MICVVGYVYKYPAFMCNGGCIFQTGHAKKRNKNGLAEPLLLLLVVFLEGSGTRQLRRENKRNHSFCLSY